ncbi:DUF2147 domain-containing protein [Mucilaginibacter sp. RS28]|uniref:DUF2147 domain-containing protein n=2 Tax=Mucilaginibacter straminoryzae TaxID=2932774 RepID=A0A9X1X1J1_9SPHI|nr:DUF2147 domain-containing protein [Mucilaginibacter straminoryzae]MCJ8209111.1 DUF2147 domain-containing protein [Mucilaginibacter straminoryzae]
MTFSKKPYITLLLVLPLVLSTFAGRAQTDKVEGLWFNDIKTAKILISKDANGKFYGKIVWLKEPLKDGKPKVDDKNPDEQLRTRPVIGLQILSDFVKDGDNKYVDGTIYDPKNGKTYSCKMTYKGKTLDIRGYIGISLLGRTTVWERTN